MYSPYAFAPSYDTPYFLQPAYSPYCAPGLYSVPLNSPVPLPLSAVRYPYASGVDLCPSYAAPAQLLSLSSARAVAQERNGVPGHLIEDEWYPSQVTSAQFRELSQTLCRAPDAKTADERTYDDQEATHRIPNAILADACNRSQGQPGVQQELVAFGHSGANITNSGHNPDHSAREARLTNGNYTGHDVRWQKQRVEAADRNSDLSSGVSSRILASMSDRGPGWNAVVARLDKNQFRTPAEKISIDAARKSDPTYTSNSSFTHGPRRHK